MITERILQILNNKQITKYKFCKDLGFSNGFLDKPREITTDKYANILVYFPDINPYWLLTGEGEMFKTNYSVETEQYSDKEHKTSKEQIIRNNNQEKHIEDLQKIIDILNTQLSIKDNQIKDLMETIKKIQEISDRHVDDQFRAVK